MRIVMIHALAESIPPVRLAFQDVFPEAAVINLLDEGLFIDFKDKLTPKLRRRMSELTCYSEEHGPMLLVWPARCTPQWWKARGNWSTYRFFRPTDRLWRKRWERAPGSG